MDEKFQNLPLRSGVGIVILNKENKIFVAKRIDNPKNFWQMPQGGVDKDEDFLSAAYRELEEETSIKDVELIKEIDEINYGPIIFLGNEFFDALPIKQVYKKKKLYFEKYVSLSHDNKKIKFLNKKANRNLIKHIQDLNLISVGNTIEYPIGALKFLKDISKKINKFKGGLLAFDYGYTIKKTKIHYRL